MLRGTQIPTQTTDARLLSSDADADWLHADPWRVMRIQAEFVEASGPWRSWGRPSVSSGQPAPSPRIPPTGWPWRWGRAGARGYAVITGGGRA